MKTAADFFSHLPLTTGIGSLPHHNVDAALAYSFEHDLPYLPQIPLRNAHEYMIPQALEGLPGLSVKSDSTLEMRYDVWESRAQSFGEKLKATFIEGQTRPYAFEAYEPHSATSSCWQPFVWECVERKIKWAKLQLAGPLTCELALDSVQTSPNPELGSQCFELVLARALAMVRRFKTEGIRVVFFWDEPGLAVLNPSVPNHLLKIQQLGVAIRSLQNEGALVGVHCCSNTHWGTLLTLKPDLLSIDTHLTLPTLCEPGNRGHLLNFLKEGGRLSLGLIDTRNEAPSPLLAKTLVSELLEPLQSTGLAPPQVNALLKQSLITPACGLALHSIQNATHFSGLLTQCKTEIQNLR